MRKNFYLYGSMHSPALFQKKGAPRQIKKKARVARRAGRVCVGSQKKARRVLCGDSASLFEKFQWLEVLQKKVPMSGSFGYGAFQR